MLFFALLILQEFIERLAEERIAPEAGELLWKYSKGEINPLSFSDGSHTERGSRRVL